MQGSDIEKSASGVPELFVGMNNLSSILLIFSRMRGKVMIVSVTRI